MQTLCCLELAYCKTNFNPANLFALRLFKNNTRLEDKPRSERSSVVDDVTLFEMVEQQPRVI